MYCGTESPDWLKVRADFKQEIDPTTDTLGVRVRYVVFGDQSEAQIRRGHGVLNRAFSTQNVQEIDKIPRTGRYPFRAVLGNPNITFRLVTIIRLPVNRFGGNPVSEATRLHPPVDGELNVYIGPSSGGILGQARLGSNVVFVAEGSLGDEVQPGSIRGYGLSKTLVHEVGHAFTLAHTFSDDLCDGERVFPDIPEQIRPNYSTQLVLENGEWTCKEDNRDKDRRKDRGRSCFQLSEENEMGINYMDYGRDDVSIMFTRSQASAMRKFVRSYFKEAETKSNNGWVWGVVGALVIIVIIIITFKREKHRNKKKKKKKKA